MARTLSIRTANKEARVRELAAKGKTLREIAAALAVEGLKVSHVAVGRFLNEETSERRDLAKSVAAVDAQATVPLITAGLRRLAEIAMRRAEETEDDGASARLVAAGSDAWMKLHKVTVGDDGAAKPDDRPLAPSTLWKVEGDA